MPAPQMRTGTWLLYGSGEGAEEAAEAGAGRGGLHIHRADDAGGVRGDLDMAGGGEGDGGAGFVGGSPVRRKSTVNCSRLSRQWAGKFVALMWLASSCTRNGWPCVSKEATVPEVSTAKAAWTVPEISVMRARRG